LKFIQEVEGEACTGGGVLVQGRRGEACTGGGMKPKQEVVREARVWFV
jgi:hypothetical protein